MSITVSVVSQESAQRDNRFWVQETHTDNIGLLYVLRYLASVGTDINAILAARAITLAQQIKDGEIAANVAQVQALGSLAATTFNYSAGLENFAALRSAYATASQEQAVMIGDFLSARTDAQLRTAFGFTQAQVDTLRANKLTPAANLATSIRAAAGQ